MESSAPEMEAAIGIAVILVFLVVLVIVIILKIFYLLTLKKILDRCSPENQAMAPGMVFLELIPVVNLVWQFFNVLNVTKSLGAELRSRGIHDEDEAPGKTLGLVMCILACCTLVPFVGSFVGIGVLVCWIMFWIKMSQYVTKLDQYIPAPAVENVSPIESVME